MTWFIIATVFLTAFSIVADESLRRAANGRPTRKKLGRVPWGSSRDTEFRARARHEGGEVVWFGDVEKRKRRRGYFVEPGDME